MISMELLVSKLKNHTLCAHQYSDESNYAAVVRNGHLEDLGNPYVIHVVTDKEYDEASTNFSGGLFIVGEHFSKVCPGDRDFAVFSSLSDLQTLIHDCCQILIDYERFQQYTLRLTGLIQKQTDFQKIFKCFADYYDNPVTFGDKGGNIIYRENIREDTTDWDEEMNYWMDLGYVPFDYQKTHGVLQDAKMTYTSSEPLIREPNESRKYRRLLYRACRVHNEYNNVFAIVEAYTPFRPFDEDALKFTGDLVTDSLPSSYFEQIDTPRNYVLRRMISEPDLNEEQINELFHRNYLPFTNYYMVAVIGEKPAPDSESEELRDFKPQNVLKLRYQKTLSNFASTFYHEDLILLLQSNQLEDLNHSLEYLERSISGTGFYIGCSEVFETLTSLHKKYQAAKLTIETGLSLRPEEKIYTYQELYFDILVSILKESGKSSVFIMEKLQKLLEQDHAKNTEYARTVYEYILCGKNINKVSQKLLLHRNTVIYRINKAKEMLNMDFENIDEVFQLFLSYKCLKDGSETTSLL